MGRRALYPESPQRKQQPYAIPKIALASATILLDGFPWHNGDKSSGDWRRGQKRFCVPSWGVLQLGLEE